jgi:CysZ protein
MAPREVKALRRANAGKVFVAGVMVACVAAIPFINFLVPLFATAFMVHVFKGVMRRQGERPPKVRMRG